MCTSSTCPLRPCQSSLKTAALINHERSLFWLSPGRSLVRLPCTWPLLPAAPAAPSLSSSHWLQLLVIFCVIRLLKTLWSYRRRYVDGLTIWILPYLQNEWKNCSENLGVLHLNYVRRRSWKVGAVERLLFEMTTSIFWHVDALNSSISSKRVEQLWVRTSVHYVDNIRWRSCKFGEIRWFLLKTLTSTCWRLTIRTPSLIDGDMKNWKLRENRRLWDRLTFMKDPSLFKRTTKNLFDVDELASLPSRPGRQPNRFDTRQDQIEIGQSWTVHRSSVVTMFVQPR